MDLYSHRARIFNGSRCLHAQPHKTTELSKLMSGHLHTMLPKSARIMSGHEIKSIRSCAVQAAFVFINWITFLHCRKLPWLGIMRNVHRKWLQCTWVCSSSANFTNESAGFRMAQNHGSFISEHANFNIYTINTPLSPLNPPLARVCWLSWAPSVETFAA